MDLSAKMQTQPTDGGKEKRYVTLEVGAKISGYTKDYLERLCRLNKVDYRLWTNGHFVIELESLLRATQTILLSREGITFVDRGELSEPTLEMISAYASATTPDDENPPASFFPNRPVHDGAEDGESGGRPVPQFSQVNRFATRLSGSKPLSFFGRAVVSSPDHIDADAKENEIHVPISVQREAAPDEEKESTHTMEKIHIPIGKDSGAVTQRVDIVADTPPKAASTIPGTPVSPAPTQATEAKTDGATAGGPTGIPARPLVFGDPQVSALFNVKEEQEVPKADIPSPYRPIKTSVDASLHHESAPLFPMTPAPAVLSRSVVEENRSEKSTTPPPATVATAEEKPVSNAIPPVSAPKKEAAIPDSPFTPPTGQRITVFEPGKTTANADIREGYSRSPIVNPPLVPSERNPGALSPLAHPLPMMEEEHHLITTTAHPLLKSPGLNLAFGLLFIGSAIFFGRSMLPGSGGIGSLAGVGAVSSPDVEQDFQPTPSISEDPEEDANSMILPFSDEVAVYQGDKPNSIIVTPIFSGGSGQSHEYAIVPVSASSSLPQ